MYRTTYSQYCELLLQLKLFANVPASRSEDGEQTVSHTVWDFRMLASLSQTLWAFISKYYEHKASSSKSLSNEGSVENQCMVGLQ